MKKLFNIEFTKFKESTNGAGERQVVIEVETDINTGLLDLKSL